MASKTLLPSLSFLLAVFCTQGFCLPKSLAQPSDPSLGERYRRAVQDAALVESGENIDSLIEIAPDNPLLVWDATKTKLLVITWKSQSSYERFIQPARNSARDENKLIWVTVAPQVKELCKQYLQEHPQATQEELELRLKQYLGLAPDWQYDVFVEMWVSPEDLFRPCVDPQIDDRQCNLGFGDGAPDKLMGITPGAAIQDYQAFYKNLYFKSIRPDRFEQNYTVRQPWTT